MRALLALLLLAAAPALAAENPTALGALKLLPPGAAERVARIEARDGAPAPERWHILAHDPEAEGGVREYVVAGGELVASRTISQFAETLRPEDVLGTDALKIDSDRAAKLARQYADANKVTVAAVHYELAKEGAEAAPRWKLTCVDAAGKDVGHLVLTASKGTVLSHEGFPDEPKAGAEKKPDKPSKPERAEARVARSDNNDRANRPERADKPERKVAPAERPVRRAEPIAPEEEPDESRPGLLRRTGGTLQRIFTGRDSLSR